jgi:glycosyltransferase involved in cell wall biosynthesis
MSGQLSPTVSIIIKALNEERHIASAIESALRALDETGGEVILADAASTDRTVEIARRYPIKIVRLNNIEDRSCGAGAQLGFQYSKGQYLCLMDGDMRLHGGFLPAAIRFMQANPNAAGVGGIIVERETGNAEFAQRANRQDPDRRPGTVTRLDCGGVYRRSAIEALGYITDRNLHAGEELDLGARLHAQRWVLARIAVPAIDHHGHAGSAFRLLLRRFRTRLSFGMGELLRAAIGRPHIWFVLRHDRKLPLAILVVCWWSALVTTPLVLGRFSALVCVTILTLFPIVAMSFRWGSLYDGLYSVAAWNLFAVSFFPGFMRPRISPTAWIESSVIQEGCLSEPQPCPQERPQTQGALISSSA